MGEHGDPEIPSGIGKALGTLAVLHYVLSAFTVLLIPLPAIYVWGGLAVMRGELDLSGSTLLNLPPEELGRLMVTLGVGGILIALLHAAVLLIMGRWIQQRRHHALLVVASGLNCLYLPFGTALSVWALILLSRPVVGREFGRK